jgi:hypothetical protein
MKGAAMRGRLCFSFFLFACAGCGPRGEPQDTAISLKPVKAQESPGPPTTLRLVLRLQPDGRVQLISTDAKRGSVQKLPENAIGQDAIEGRHRVVEYTARDRAGAVVATGRFTIPVKAVAEFQDPDVRTRIRRAEEPLATPTVRVSIPYHPSIATISFEQLDPNRDVPIEKWIRKPLGEVSVSPSAEPGQQQPQQQPPPAQQP